jgi:hypothetical protein
MPVICHISRQADGLEFVVCDMKKQYWDNPPDWYGKKNYQITVPWTLYEARRSAEALVWLKRLGPNV